jgi:hypothetical protein
MISLVVANTEILLQPGDVIQLQKAASKIGELGRRQGVYTNDFQVQMSVENLAALGFPNLPSISSARVNYRRRIEAQLSQGAIKISRGFVQIVRVDFANQTITVSFFGGNSGWATALAGVKISDIDLDDLNHIWDAATIVGSFSNTSGFIYPLINYGLFDGENVFTRDFPVTDFYPAIYQKEIIARALSQVGYKVSGSFLDEFAYQNAIIPFASRDFLSSPDYAAQFVGDMTGALLIAGSFVSPTTIFDVNRLEMFSANQDVFNSFSVPNSTFTAPRAETYNMRLYVDFSNLEIDQTGGSALGVKTVSLRATDQTGTEILTAQPVFTSTTVGSVSTSGVFVFEFPWTAAIGEEIKAELVFDYTNLGTPVTLMEYVAEFNSYTLSVDSIDRTMEPGDTVELAYVLPDLLVVDVIRDMAQRHGLIVNTDDNSQTVSFDRFERMPTRHFVDWSDKVNLLDVHEVNFSEVVDGYFKVNRWAYQESSEDDTALFSYDQENEIPLGAGEFEIDSDWLDNEGTIYTSIYKASAMQSPWLGGSRLYVPEIRRYDDLGEEKFAPEARILYVLPDSPVSEVGLGILTKITIDGTDYTNIAYAFFYLINSGGDIQEIEDSLSYGTVAGIQSNQVGLIEKNYSQIERILNTGRGFEVSFLLSEYEFSGLDFSQPIYLDAGLAKGLFFIDEVSGYEGATVPCQASLIQIS